jgi:two-component system LytT family response regulator
MNKAVIIEDEKAGQELIRHYMKKHAPDFEITAMIDNVPDAVDYLSKHEVNLVLMDIQIKLGTGFDILNAIPKKNFEIIFITAFDQYAIQAIRNKAFDYILKPVVEAEFVNAIRLVDEKLNVHKTDKGAPHIIISRNNKVEKLDVGDIIFFEADGAYTYIQTIKEKIYTSKNLGEYESQVSHELFVRSHHSYLVNMDHVLSIEKKRSGILELTNGYRIPVSQRRIADFVQHFRNREK